MPTPRSGESDAGSVSAERLGHATAAIQDRRPRVLVVEDDPTNQIVVKATLTKAGIKPDLANDGREAVEAAARACYDLILMDVQMPGMDGLEATRAIRALPGPESKALVMALTANASASDIDACKAAGMNGHIRKPFRPQDLIVAIADALDGQQQFKATRLKPQSGNEVIDLAAIERFRSDSGEEMLRMLIDGYLTDAAEKLSKLARLAGNTAANDEAARIAHSLKSSSRMAGAAALATAAEELEGSIVETSVPVTPVAAESMQAMLAGYRAALVERGLVA